MAYHGQCEGQRLARACLGDTYHVAPRKRDREGLRLDRCRRLQAQLHQQRQHLAVESQLNERLDRVRNVRTLCTHGELFAQDIDVRSRHAGNGRVHRVEALAEWLVRDLGVVHWGEHLHGLLVKGRIVWIVCRHAMRASATMHTRLMRTCLAYLPGRSAWRWRILPHPSPHRIHSPWSNESVTFMVRSGATHATNTCRTAYTSACRASSSSSLRHRSG